MKYLLLASILFAKLVDIHIPSPSEIHEIERGEQERDRDRDNDIRQDPKASEEKKYEAERSLIDGGHAV